ncbi:MAG: hypothetical protein H6Q73_1356 [Firmicutes bacterium]|nr:hypothetical protein [Bacillota bacterium]
MERKRIFELFQELRGIENVVGVGNGIKQVRGENTGKQAAVILVKKKYAKDNLRRSAIIPKRIDGMLTDVVE